MVFWTGQHLCVLMETGFARAKATLTLTPLGEPLGCATPVLSASSVGSVYPVYNPARQLYLHLSKGTRTRAWQLPE